VIRLSVTDLESYRWWKDREDSDLSTLLAQLAHTDTPTPAMEAGRAFAKLFETAQHGEIFSCSVDGWGFTFDLDEEIAIPDVRELKAEQIFNTPHGPVTLVGKVDGFDGTVYDQKLTERFDIEGKYTDSLQWRAYLVMFDAQRFLYDVFVGRRDDARKDVTIYEYHRVPFYAYPSMRADVERAVCELAAIVATYGVKAA
jgi:hypothetical protein